MAQRLRALTVAMVAVALAGCWYQPGQGPNRASYNPFETQISPANVADLTEQWTAPTEAGGVSDPVVSNAGVHVSAGDVSYYGFDPATGARLWKHDVAPEGSFIFAAQPFADAGTLLVSYGRGNLGGSYTLERLDGATGASLGILDGFGVVNGQRGSLMVQHRVGFGSGGPVATSLKVSDSEDPNVGWSGIIHVTQNSSAASVTLGETGVYQAGAGIVSVANPASPTIGNGVRAWPLSAVPHCGPGDAISCPTWATPLDGSGTVPVLKEDQSTLYTATSAGTVYAVSTVDGSILWSASLGAGAASIPALAEGILYVPTVDGRLVALDVEGCGGAATCSSLWTATGGTGSISGQPAVAGGVVFTGWGDGSVHAFLAAGCGAATCSSVWSASTGSAISGAPAVTNGQLYVGTQDGRVIAYGLD